MWHMSPPNQSVRPRWDRVVVSVPDDMADGTEQTDRPFLIKDGKVCDHPQLD